MNKKNGGPNPQDLGVFRSDNKIFIYLNLFGSGFDALRLAVGKNGYAFKLHPKNPVILDKKNKKEKIQNLSNFRVSKSDKKFFLVYNRTLNHKTQTFIASSKDAILWKNEGELSSGEIGMIVPDYKKNGKYALYFGDGKIKIAYSNDFKTWNNEKEVLSPRTGSFDNFPLSVLNVSMYSEGILVLYSVNIPNRDKGRYSVGAALFDRNNPEKLLFRVDEPIWEPKKELKDKDIYPLGAVILNDDLFLYFVSEQKSVYAIHFANFIKKLLKNATAKHPALQKHFQNPIIEPVIEHFWESRATFNPAAIKENGKVHFVYRAIGDNNVSVLGYASSSDGITIDERLDEPIYIPTEPFEYTNGDGAVVHFMSGGGYGGCEDPRLTKIDDRIYMTYVAFNGFDPPRVALTSIKTEDFLNKDWKWDRPKIISKPGVVDKNAAIFPEKINGKYALLHRIFPNILLDFVDDLEFKDNNYLKGEFKIAPKLNGWDSRKIGAGPPPIKTRDGWLLIYHAVDDKDDSKYKIGAMLLDLNDPSKVIYRTRKPILEPTEVYENEGYKSGVAYPCGAAVVNGILYVYYGGADKVVCTAHKNLNKLLSELKSSGYIELDKEFRSVPIYKHND